jgi:hypothetical protein
MKLIKGHVLQTKQALRSGLTKSSASGQAQVLVFGGVQGTQLAVGATSDRPTASTGVIRFNSSNSVVEYYDGSAWETLGASGSATITKDNFTGDGTSTLFGPLSFAPANDNAVLVYIQNVWQEGGYNYTTSGTNIQFGSPVPNGHRIVVLHGFDTV